MSSTPPDPPDEGNLVVVGSESSIGSAGDPGPEEGSDTPPDSLPGTGPRGARKKRKWRGAIEWGVILAVAVLAALLLRGFVIQPYYIPSGSMEPTLQVGDKVLVNKLSYHFHPVHRGDVVVFAKPPNDYSPGIKDLIKRVIGLPGETISASGGSVHINGKVLPEPWLPKGTVTSDFGPVHIPAGEFFVMGDNRDNSADSRVIGPIQRKLIVGRAFLLVWPLGRIGWL